MISDCLDINKGMTSSELIQNLLLSGSCPEIQGSLQVRETGKKGWKRSCFFLRKSGLYHSNKGSSKNLLLSGSCPEIQGSLQVRETGKKGWKRSCFFLRKSGLYHSNKGSSKEPRHLQYVADLEELNIYSVSHSRKLYGAPSDFTFCIKPCRKRFCARDLKLLCAEDERTRACWITAFRLFKFGQQLRCNYQLSMSTKNQDRGRLPTGKRRMFLIRESQQHANCFVLSLCYQQKTKHYLIIQCEEEGRLYYTMDDGLTLFTDLIQLVEFHQINCGILPVRLKHYCACVAM
ncbi:UNVERIFIED_CONTAM: hypothetical protein FKN15_051605 [Acipenser sinensis]